MYGLTVNNPCQPRPSFKISRTVDYYLILRISNERSNSGLTSSTYVIDFVGDRSFVMYLFLPQLELTQFTKDAQRVRLTVIWTNFPIDLQRDEKDGVMKIVQKRLKLWGDLTWN